MEIHNVGCTRLYPDPDLIGKMDLPLEIISLLKHIGASEEEAHDTGRIFLNLAGVPPMAPDVPPHPPTACLLYTSPSPRD